MSNNEKTKWNEEVNNHNRCSTVFHYRNLNRYRTSKREAIKNNINGLLNNKIIISLSAIEKLESELINLLDN